LDKHKFTKGNAENRFGGNSESKTMLINFIPRHVKAARLKTNKVKLNFGAESLNAPDHCGSTAMCSNQRQRRVLLWGRRQKH
jgi:hypothetical protein